jgi:predicted nuclease of predicted toxin-antitoxin system
MKLYLDDDSASALLARLLQHAGHTVLLPATLGMSGAKDPKHLRQAIREQAMLLSHNYEDFEILHELLMEGHGHHPGILVGATPIPHRFAVDSPTQARS